MTEGVYDLGGFFSWGCDVLLLGVVLQRPVHSRCDLELRHSQSTEKQPL